VSPSAPGASQGDAELRRLYEVTPALLHSIDAEGCLIDVSNAWLEHLGYERAEVLGRRSSEFLTPASRDKARDEVLPAFFRVGRCDNIEYQFICKDGRVVDMLLSATLERHADGRPLRSLAVLQDITERKRLAAELQRTLGDLNAIIDNVPATLGYWDRNGVTRLANREFQAAVGLPVGEIVGKRLQDIFDAVDPVAYDTMAPYIARVLEGRREEFEVAMLTTNGLRQLHVTLVPDQAAGEVSGFYALGYDVTGRKALELRLSDSEMRYRALFDHLASGFALHEIVVGPEGRPRGYKVLAMNAVYAKLLGVTASERAGGGSSELAPDFDGTREDWIRRFGEVALKGADYRGEHQLGGDGLWVEVVAYQPAPGQFALLVQDIGARKAAEATVQRQQLRLTQALGEKETLLKEVHHRAKSNVPVVESTRDLLSQIAEVAGQRHIALRAEIEVTHTGLDGALPLGLLLAELVGNAFKHGFRGRAKGEIHVSLRPGPEGAELVVRDDGVGLPQGFDLAGVPTMGLRLAASLARQLGGELRVQSERGACFSATLRRL
jgi:PAS domain S-box-containing protein